MFARSTTITARPSMLDHGIWHMQEQTMPALVDIRGCIGMSVLVNRDSGRCIATSSWDSEDAMHASAGAVESLRAAARERFGGNVESVEEWEIAVLHRAHEASAGAWVRCTWLQAPRGEVERPLDAFRRTVLPQAEQLAGFCSASLLVNRETDRAVGAMAWDSYAALDASRKPIAALRADTTSRTGTNVLDVAEFELALAHLRVPETV